MQQAYAQRRDRHAAQRRLLERSSNRIGYAKLLIVVAIIVTLAMGYDRGFPVPFVALAVAELAAAVWLWVRHAALHEAIERESGLVAVYERHIGRIEGAWTAFPDDGAAFADRDHPYARDLDIVGPKSLYQYVSAAHTWHGRQALARDLLHAAYDAQGIRARQAAVAELAGDIDFAARAEASLARIGAHENMQRLVDDLRDRRDFPIPAALGFAARISPAIALIALAADIAFGMPIGTLVGGSILALQTLAWVLTLPKTGAYMGALGSLPYRLEGYRRAIDIINAQAFESESLRGLQARLGMEDGGAARALRELTSISDAVNARRNGIMLILLNMLFNWDVRCCMRYARWKARYAGAARGWFEAIGDFESLLSLSLLPNIHETTCVPELLEERRVEARSMGHPLLPEATCVRNDWSTGPEIWLISGSNMSGKTTFLRTVGINLVLLRAGGYACARALRAAPLRPMTSMRIADDLSEGISTFYAELKRIKAILEAAQGDPSLLFLVDEIFKGTNSADRLEGARAVLERFDAMGAMGLMTTHDLELCAVADRLPRGRNGSFSERYAGERIVFDYRLREGRSETTNARYLMRMVGIVE